MICARQDGYSSLYLCPYSPRAQALLLSGLVSFAAGAAVGGLLRLRVNCATSVLSARALVSGLGVINVWVEDFSCHGMLFLEREGDPWLEAMQRWLGHRCQV